MVTAQIAQTSHSTRRSEELLNRACRSLAGGDSSTMRVLPYHLPLVAAGGKGCRIWDADGNEYIDLNMAYGPLLLGHCPPSVVEGVTEQIGRFGSQLGFPTEIGTEVAELLQSLFPSMQLMRFSNSGTEACHSAVRLARTFTGRRRIIQFEGHYHGWSDPLFTKYHAPLDELPEGPYAPAIPGTKGMNGAPHDSLMARWNDLDALQQCFEDHPGEIAAVIMEPVMGNAGVIPPHAGYLQGVRELTRDHGALLIFDEVITGLRVAIGGAQEKYQVRPDITVVSKAIGGGYPVSAVGASREIMDLVVRGEMFHGGVFSGNAVVMAAARSVLREVTARRDEIYPHLQGIGDELAAGIEDVFSMAGIPVCVQHVGPMLSMFLTNRPVEAIRDYRDVRRCCDFDRYIRLQHALQRTGIYFHPNQFEPMFLCTEHRREEIGIVLERLERALSTLED